MKCITLLVVLTGLLQSRLATAQQASTAAANDNVVVLKDPRLDLLVKKQVYINTLSVRNMAGFRVQVLTSNDRAKAMAMRAQMMRMFPEYRAYISYQAPYFKVRIGDFKTREEAKNAQAEINKILNDGIFTVPDIINITPEKDDLNDPLN